VEFFNKKKILSQTVAHFGFSLFVLSILLNNITSSEVTTNMKVGERYKYDEGVIFFQKIEEKKESNFNSIVGHFKITNNRGDIFSLKPELRIYNQPIIVTSEADIKTTLLKDNFLVMNTVKGNEYFNIRYQVKPFMLWIWISVLLISFGGMISFLRVKNEK
jgi:cytochrome c-type biogenesis protein CcmF